MAIVPAAIDVNFIANTVGQHRVCYRLNNIGPYTCIIGTCAIVGACTITIPITVDNETCIPVEFDGYAQALCEDSASTKGRIPFSVTFTPVPACAKYTVTCLSAPVGSVIINNPGSSYNPTSVPSISFSGGGGTGASALVVIGPGAITTTNIAFATFGAGYVDGAYANVPLLGGTGSGAQASISVVGGVATYGIITNPGTGYITGNILTPDPTFMGPSVPAAPITFTINSDYGTVLGITMTSFGFGYTSAPAVVIDPPVRGTQAIGTAVLGYCDPLLAPSCDGSTFLIVDALHVGDHTDICKQGDAPVFVAPSPYEVVPSGNCLCECQTVTITEATGMGIVNYWYNKCNGGYTNGFVFGTSSPSGVTDCVIPGSVIAISGEGGGVPSIVYSGNCP